MSTIEVGLSFKDGFNGVLEAKNTSIQVGGTEGTVAPYDMLLGALGSCLYATFLDIAVKKRIEYDRVEIKIKGEKRTEVPMTLKEVDIEAVVYGSKAEKEKGLTQAFQLATRYCSVFQTVAKVAEMHPTIRFEA
ncbi:MAG: hypothetical protein PWQ12_247 [Clostridiales bacterium]|nr:hypothetical protein [Clostridiales bacterium]